MRVPHSSLLRLSEAAKPDWEKKGKHNCNKKRRDDVERERNLEEEEEIEREAEEEESEDRPQSVSRREKGAWQGGEGRRGASFARRQKGNLEILVLQYLPDMRAREAERT